MPTLHPIHRIINLEHLVSEKEIFQVIGHRYTLHVHGNLMVIRVSGGQSHDINQFYVLMYIMMNYDKISC